MQQSINNPERKGLFDLCREAVPGENDEQTWEKHQKLLDYIMEQTPPYVDSTIVSVLNTLLKNTPKTFESEQRKRVMETAKCLPTKSEDKFYNICRTSDEDSSNRYSSRGIVPNILHWQWYGGEIGEKEIKNVLNIAQNNPKFEKIIWTDNEKSILKALNKVFSKYEIDFDPAAYLKAYGIKLRNPKELFSQPWEKPHYLEGVTSYEDHMAMKEKIFSFCNSSKEFQETRRQLELMQAYEGMGTFENFASKKDLNAAAVVFTQGGWCLDWDVEGKDAIPLNYKVPAGMAIFRHQLGPPNNDIVCGSKGNSLAAILMQEAVSMYRENFRKEFKLEKGVEEYGIPKKHPPMYHKKRIPNYNTLEERSSAFRVSNDRSLDPRLAETVLSTGPGLYSRILSRPYTRIDAICDIPESIHRNPSVDGRWSIASERNRIAREIVGNPSDDILNVEIPSRIPTEGRER